MYYYAQINADNICAGISQLSGEVNTLDTVCITEAEFTIELIGCEYLGNGEWGGKTGSGN